MKKVLPLLLLIPCLAFGGELREHDWFRVVKGFSGHGVFEEFNARPGDFVYVYIIDKYVHIAIFNLKGYYQGYWWVKRGKDKLTNPEYCVWLENRVDKRFNK